jgi:hypothetical protein
VGVTLPTGNQRNVSANAKIKSMPMKKVGSEKVVRELVTKRLSIELPRLLETRIPSNVPITMDNTVEVPNSNNVFSNLPEVTISSLTGRLSL